MAHYDTDDATGMSGAILRIGRKQINRGLLQGDPFFFFFFFLASNPRGGGNLLLTTPVLGVQWQCSARGEATCN